MKIGIVNDVELAVEALRRAIASRPEHRVAWVARDGVEAVRWCACETPDVVLMDLVMPVMDGVEATRRIMAKTPCAILVTTADVKVNADKVFAALGYGALDAINTPTAVNGRSAQNVPPLLVKLDAIQHSLNLNHADPAPTAAPNARRKAAHHLMAIGASAGGPAAVQTVLRALPENFPAGIVIIQHIDTCFAPGLATWLSQESRIPVRLAIPGDEIAPGQALLADGTSHLVIGANCRLAHTTEPGGFYTPSVDAFFASVQRYWSGDVTAVLLTGMGRDGSIGLKSLHDRGVHTIAQDEATSAVYGMPKAAARLGAATEILPLDRIGPALVSRMRTRFTTSTPNHC